MMTHVLSEVEVSRWAAEYEKWQRVRKAAYAEWARVMDQWNTSTDQDEREQLWAQSHEVWRARGIAVVYADLAEVREYIAKFGLDMPGLEIPDELFT